MKVSVVGAGAIGCYLGARLQDAGHKVLLVGQGANIKAIRENGLMLKYTSGLEKRYRLDTASDMTEAPDLILMTVKTQDVETACESFVPHAAGTPVVMMQNGLRAEHIAAEVLGKDSIIGAVVMCSTTYVVPGEVTVQFPGWLIVGEPFLPTSSRTHEVVETLNSALPTYLTRSLPSVRWSKLISNLNNGLCAATGLTLTELFTKPETRLLPVRVMKEGYKVARAAGIKIDKGLYGLSPRAFRQDHNSALVALLQGAMGTALGSLPEATVVRLMSYAARGNLHALAIRGSTWQSIARGKPTEIEYLNGEISRLGRELGVLTPYNDRVVECVHRVERTHKLSDPSELWPHTTLSNLPKAKPH